MKCENGMLIMGLFSYENFHTCKGVKHLRNSSPGVAPVQFPPGQVAVSNPIITLYFLQFSWAPNF